MALASIDDPSQDTSRDPYLDAICRTARAVFGLRYSGVSFVGPTHLWFAGSDALPQGIMHRAETFCSLTVATAPGHVFVVPDASRDPRFRHNAAVDGPPYLRFYAGLHLCLAEADYRAALCVMDDRADVTFGDTEIAQLRDLGAILEAYMRLRASQDQRIRDAVKVRATLDCLDQGIVATDAEGRIQVFNARLGELLTSAGTSPAEGRLFSDLWSNGAHAAAGRGGAPAWAAVTSVSSPADVEEAQPGGPVLHVRLLPMAGGGLVRTIADVTARRAAEQALVDSERRYRLLAENTTDIIFWNAISTERRYVSPAVKTVLGYEPSALIGTKPIDFVHPDDKEKLSFVLARLTRGLVSRGVFSSRYRHADGRWIWLEVSFSLTRDAVTGEPDGYVATLRDVSARKRAEAAHRASEARLRISEERLALALDSGPDGLFDWDLASRDLWISKRFLSALGHTNAPMLRRALGWRRIAHPHDIPVLMGDLRRHFDGRTASVEQECRLRQADGTYVWTLIRGRVADRDAQGRVRRFVGTVVNISRQKEAEIRAMHRAEHDALTALPNRSLFTRFLHEALAHAVARPGCHAVLACDLDRFKAVNDTFGHPIGDHVLRVAADRIRNVVRADDRVARLGGDEFAIVLNGADGEGAVRATCERLIAAMGEPIVINGHAVEIGVSIGAALLAGEGLTGDAIVNLADFALYEAKAAGRNTYRIAALPARSPAAGMATAAETQAVA